MPNGILTQSIANVQQTEATIRAFSGLPPQAVSIQTQVDQVVTDLLPQVQSMQQQVLAAGQRLQTALEQQLSNPDNLTPASLQQFIGLAEDALTPVSSVVTATQRAATDANNQITQDDLALQQLGVSLQSQIAGLNGKLTGAQQSLDDLNKKKLYLLALGILGIPGLIALAVTLSQAQDEVNSLQSEIAQTQAQIQTQQGFLTQVTGFAQQFSNVIDTITKVGNTLTFLSGDVGSAEHDVGSATSQTVQLFFTAALLEVKTLISDAS